MFGMSTIETFITPISFLIGGILLGLVFDRFVMKELKKFAAKTKWEGDEVVIHAAHGMIFVWFVLAGLYGALQSIEIKPAALAIALQALRVVAILTVTIVAARIAAGFVDLYSRRAGGVFTTTSLFSNITKSVVYALGFLVILDSLGISITPMLTALGVGGLAVALALQDTLSNLFAGIHIIASKKLRPGDFVKLETGQEGYVADIAWRNTTIREIPNNLVVVPNAKLASTIVTNCYLPDAEMAVVVQVGVAYGSDLEKVQRVTAEVGREVMMAVEGGVPDFEPFIRYHTFGDSSINFNVILRTREFAGQHLIRHEFIQRLQKRYQEEGIEIPFPIRTVHLEEKRKEGTL